MSRYNNILILKGNRSDKPIKYYTNNLYPEIKGELLDPNDIFMISSWGDTLTSIADEFYNDVNLYWVISITNPNKIPSDSLYIPPGTQLRIPIKIDNIMDEYILLNT
jgi:hypothetical protein